MSLCVGKQSGEAAGTCAVWKAFLADLAESVVEIANQEEDAGRWEAVLCLAAWPLSTGAGFHAQ